ncbi:hypothetical protein EDB86DRAFT_2833350 [Lactarius hatsudake]|nr:hypothetical protein EDB86DRAFT_2833350 [Lactarius hatsudake]
MTAQTLPISTWGGARETDFNLPSWIRATESPDQPIPIRTPTPPLFRRPPLGRSYGAKWAHTVIVDPGVWHGTSAIAPATTVARANLCRRRGGSRRAARSAGLPRVLVSQTITGITPKAGTNSLAVAENAENQDRTGAVQTKKARDPIAAARQQRQHPVRNRDDPECTPHRDTRGSPTATPLLGAQRPRSMSTLAARRAEP